MKEKSNIESAHILTVYLSVHLCVHMCLYIPACTHVKLGSNVALGACVFY